jgi:hypothetical protein
MKKGIFTLLLLGAASSVAYGVSRIHFLTVDEMPAALESITNVSSREPEIESFFADRRDGFPKFGTLDEVNAGQLGATLSYSGLYCRKMVERDAGKDPADRFAHSAIPFDRAPTDWAPDVLDRQLDQYASMFWQRALAADERATFRDLANQLTSDLPKEPASAIPLLTSLCGVFGTSFSFLSQ